MVIQRIETSNFRSLKEVDLSCSDLLAILGRNGAGKSSVLHALDVFYDTAVQITPFDYFDKDTNAEIKIRVTYGQLRADELGEFAAYVSDGKLVVTKVINSGGTKYYASSRQFPEFVEIRKLQATQKRQEFNTLVLGGRYPDLNQKANSAQAVEETMSGFESLHPELLRDFQKETQFFGPRNVGGGKLDKYTKFVLIPAVRDASAETERRGAILQLIDVLVMRSVSSRADVRALNAEFETRVKQIYSGDNLTELNSLGILITQVLKKYSPGAELDLTFGDVALPKLTLPPAIASLVEDNFKCPINYSGHGLQRALIFALLQQLSLTEPISPEEKEPHSDVATQKAMRTPDLILAIEEPELYLHPSRCRYLSKMIFQLTREAATPDEPRTQILYATHSPYFIDLQRFDQIKVATKIPVVGTKTLQTKISFYTREEASNRLADICQKDPNVFDDQSFVAHASPVMNTIVNEGFFADVVVVVEGDSEVAVFWALQLIKSHNWDALGVSLVPVGGKNNIDRPVVIFQGLGIKTYFIFDGDSGLPRKELKNAAKKNHSLLRLAGAQPIDFPPTGVQNTWAVFANNLETEIQQAIGEDRFDEIRKETAEQLGYSKPSAVLKNSEGAALFINRVYESGLCVPVLEKVVELITALRQPNPTPSGTANVDDVVKSSAVVSSAIESNTELAIVN